MRSALPFLIAVAGVFPAPLTVAQSNLPPVPPVKLKIPVRIVETLSCNPALPSCNKRTDFQDAQVAIDRANFHWRFAGVQFWIKSFEYVEAPNLFRREVDADDDGDIDGDPLAWEVVKDELRAIFPNMPSTAFVGVPPRFETGWMRAATLFYADPNEVFIWGVNGQSASYLPWNGRLVMLSYGNLGIGSSGIPATTFGHELGHYFGLRHLDEDGLPPHPVPGLSYDYCDVWDTFYQRLPGNIPVFFSGPNDPACATTNGANIRPFSEIFDLRAAAADAMATAHAGPYAFFAGAPEVSGAFAATGALHNPPDWGYAMNMMGHIDNEISPGIDLGANDPEDIVIDGRTPRFMSSSQIALVDDYLNNDYDYASLAAQLGGIGGSTPPGAVPSSATSLRTKLGKSNDYFLWRSNAQVRADFSFTSVTNEVSDASLVPLSADFDCNGADDLAWYNPTLGAIKVWWASAVDGSFDTSGAWGTTLAERFAFAGDFDGNTCGDVFLYGSGSASDVILNGRPTRQWSQVAKTMSGVGYRPFSADLEGDGDDDIVWYKPLLGTADIWYGTGTTLPSSSINNNFSTTTNVAVGSGKFYQPIVGNFDGINGDEVLWYLAGGGTDVVWRSLLGTSSLEVDGYYRPIVGDFNDDGREDILWDDFHELRSPIWEGVNTPDLFEHVSQVMNGTDHSGVPGDFNADGATDIFYYRDALQNWVTAFHYNQGWRTTLHLRLLGDLNGDGKKDVVGFGNSGTEVSLSTGSSFQSSARWVENFHYDAGWRLDRHPRFLADVDGDGDDDVVGIGNSGVYVAKSTGTGLGAVNNWLTEFHYNDNWLVDRHPRMMGDVTGDGKADLVGIGNNAVLVATSIGTDFNAATNWVTGFNYNAGWRVDRHPRMLADADGDGKMDVIGFGNAGVEVSYSNGASFTAPSLKVAQFGWDQSWRIEKHPRMMADVNGDGRADIVGFSNDGVMVSRALSGRSFAAPATWSNDFGYDDSWRVETHPRFLEDVNGDGKADIIAFGNRTVFVAFSTGTSFTAPVEWIEAYTPERGSWSVVDHPRLLGDVTGDGRADIVGFGGSASFVTPSRLNFGP